MRKCQIWKRGVGHNMGDMGAENDRIRIFLADDHDVVIVGVTGILAEQSDMVIVDSAQTGRGLLEKIEAARPDVVLLDIKMPDFSLYKFLPEIQALDHAPDIIIVSAMADYYLAAKAEALGIAGYLLKEDALSNDLPFVIRGVANGMFTLSIRVQNMLTSNLRYLNSTELSEEQYRVLGHMVNGHTAQEIADIIGKKVTAVYSAQQRIREKLDVETSEQAIVRAIRERLVEIGDAGDAGAERYSK